MEISLTLLLANVVAQIALADFREAMRTAVGTGFFCYRAIEAMMQSLKGAPEDSDASAWKRLREKLCIDRSAIDEVKRHADFARHGKPSSITDSDRSKVLATTDEIIRRFLHYLVGNKVALTERDFPIVKENVLPG